MKVLLVHNSYQQAGGEDAVVASEIELLRRHGHEVACYGRSNHEIGEMARLNLARDTLWSSRSTAELEEMLRHIAPDVMHVHNTFPLISPSAYWAADAAKVPVVQTLHNFRLLCPQATYLRDGKVCEDCAGTLPWRGVVRACYRGSIAQSMVLASMLTLHRSLGTYRNKVTRYIALSEFGREKLIAGGLPAKRIVVKPNFVDSPASASVHRDGFLFVGRLSEEKGVSVLAEGARLGMGASVRVAGSGPEAGLLVGIPTIHSLGRLTNEGVRTEMAIARALLVPSIAYETFGMVVLEAFACGLPVIASRIGALPELVEDGVTGLLFEPGNAQELATKTRWAAENPEAMANMGRLARQRYEQKYTGAKNYPLLMRIYADAIEERRAFAA